MLKALGVCGNNPFRVQNGHGELDPGLSPALQPWADISQRLRRFNPGLTLANAFGVSTWLKLANAAGAPTLG